jgi:hypothetical protein
MTTTVPQSRLPKLRTSDLISQYELAISSFHGRYSNTGPRQKRIDFIVELILDRAENDDAEAIEFLKI